jgi:CRISPR-associated endonuclease/helicase Cas3
MTSVAWRDEVGVLSQSSRNDHKLSLTDEQRAELLELYPLKPHELLHDRSDRVFKSLQSLAKEHPDTPIWLLDKDGSVEHLLSGPDGAPRPLTLGVASNKSVKDRIHGKTVLLPPTAGGLKRGFFSGDRRDTATDVADDWRDEDNRRRRARIWDDEADSEGIRRDMRLVWTIDTGPPQDDDEEDGSSKNRLWEWYVRPQSADDDASRTSQGAVSWTVHTKDVEERATKIVDRLPVSRGVRASIVFAARAHDLGKQRVVWQRSIGNPSPSQPLAKSGRHYKFGNIAPIESTDYRHEFGSLIDVLDEPDFRTLTDEQRDLVLHLIAAHHGYGRPHFPSELAYDPEPKGRDVGRIASEVPGRFARLQRTFGRWGLAYLESLLRAADYAASAKPSSTLETRDES